jgi:hypothetical protein
MDYRDEQMQNQAIVQKFLHARGEAEVALIRDLSQDYLRFRKEVARFQTRYLQSYCNASCFQQQRSACCNKDGIITFFADLVVNAVVSTSREMAALMGCLQHPRNDMKCLYLGSQGCRWRIKPIVCEMFVCERVKQKAIDASSQASGMWRELEKRALSFRWPDQVVLFDQIESRFLAAGVRSSLMYLHNSPGLIRIKKNAGLI